MNPDSFYLIYSMPYEFTSSRKGQIERELLYINNNYSNKRTWLWWAIQILMDPSGRGKDEYDKKEVLLRGQKEK